MSATILIPTHMGSRRFPGKALAPLRGAKGNAHSLIERCYRAAQLVGDARVLVATDSDDITAHIARIGGAVLRTGAAQNGTERCAQAAVALDDEIIVNFQGDAPLIPPDFIQALLDFMRANPQAAMATPIMECDREMLMRLRGERHHGRIGGTTAVADKNGRALYFSKEILPISDGLAENPGEVHLHIGLYAYRRDALLGYGKLPIGALEKIEALEQLRFVENGIEVHCVKVEAKGRAFWEVNNPEDVPVVEAALKARGIE